jgi:hypothetical protein
MGWRFGSRTTVEETISIDAAYLNRNGYLSGISRGTLYWKWGNEVRSSISIQVSAGLPDGNDFVRLTYTNTDRRDNEENEFDYRIHLVSTHCQYGGRRYWFCCPLVGCGRRVRKLYLPSGGNYFGCRHCYNLTYESCNESHGFIDKFARSYGLTVGQLKKGLRRY